MPPARATARPPLPPRLAYLLCAATALTLAACLAPRSAGPAEGVTYHGLLPCRDCAAVATTLTLRGEGYVLEWRQIGRGGRVAIERGQAKLRRSGALRLFPESGSVPAWLELDGDEARVLALDGYGYRDDTTEAYTLHRQAPVRLGPDDAEYFVDSERVACRRPGGQPATCLQVVGAADAEDTWTTLPTEIAGFTFEPGVLYHLIVRGSAAGPELVRVVGRQAERRPVGGTVYALESAGRTPAPHSGAAVPTLRLDVPAARVVGHDGCNPFQARLEAVGAREIKIGPPAGPRGDCPDEGAAAAFRQLLKSAAGYRLDDATASLVLLDARGTPLATLRGGPEARLPQ